MGDLFNMDGPIYKVGMIIADIFILNMLWVLCSIPVITIGASTTALFYVCGKKIRGEDGYTTKDFFKSFKMNFKQSTIVTILLIFAIIIIALDYKILPIMGDMRKILSVVLLVICFELTITAIYVFPVLSKFYIKTSRLIKTAFLMANRHLITTIASLLLAVLIVYLLFKFSFIMFFMISGYAYIMSFLFQRVFKKYLPEEE